MLRSSSSHSPDKVNTTQQGKRKRRLQWWFKGIQGRDEPAQLGKLQQRFIVHDEAVRSQQCVRYIHTWARAVQPRKNGPRSKRMPIQGKESLHRRLQLRKGNKFSFCFPPSRCLCFDVKDSRRMKAEHRPQTHECRPFNRRRILPSSPLLGSSLLSLFFHI